MAETGKKPEKAFKKLAPGILPDDRPQPHNLNAEKAVIAAMLLEPGICIDFAIEKLGDEKVFYSPAYRTLFKTIVDMHKNDIGVDLISLSDALAKEHKLEQIGGEIFLAETQNSIATTANIETWCVIVREYSILRDMINICVESVETCYDADGEINDIIGKIEGDIYDVRYKHVQPDIFPFKKHIEETFKNVEKILRKEVEIGIPTPYADLNRMIIGMKPGEMIVLAARPSIGKTSLALNFIRYVALKGDRGRPIAFFSLEMTAEQITRRLLCTESGIPESAFFDGSFKSKSDMSRLTRAVSSLQKANIFIDPTGGLTISELSAKARRLKALNNIELIVIDYLQLMKVGGRIESRQQEVAEISSGIKKLAKDLGVPVLVLAQLNREVEKGASKASRPKLSHLRESGAIEQDADVVAFLHRDRDETKDLSKEAQREGVESMLIVEKNRNGQTGIVNLKFYPQTMEFKSASRYSDEDNPERIDQE
jgi:replicative DNA helicase